jgi:hypothetical protein
MDDFFKSRTTIIILSILWGLGLASLFNMSCKPGQKCETVEYIGPPQSITKQVWSFDESMKQCHIVNPKIIPCPQ